MKLYLMRHGEYEANNIKQRGALNEKGTADIEAIADFLSHSQLSFSTIFHSGKLRAEQTATIIAKALHCDTSLKIYPHINPQDEVDALVNDIKAWHEDTLVVGHLPYLSRLVGKLVVNDANKELITFYPGTLACLEQIDSARFVIRWVLATDLFPSK